MIGDVSGMDNAGQVAAANLLRNQGVARGGVPSAAQLMPKAKEFESILLGQWLQGAESSFGSVPGADEDQDAGDDQIKSFAVQQLAKGMSDAGGVGIATIVSKALARDAAAGDAAPRQGSDVVSR